MERFNPKRIKAQREAQAQMNRATAIELAKIIKEKKLPQVQQVRQVQGR